MKISRVVAPNPGMFTGSGTNTWLVESDGRVVVIDPGPDLPEHRAALSAAVARLEPDAVLVTHCHLDHVHAANPLAAELGVPAMGACPGPSFKPDRVLADGDLVTVGTVDIEVIETPGHTADHLCYRAGEALFTGDHIMGGTSVIVEHMADYLESLEKIRGIGVTMLYPAHGEPMDDPDEVIDWYVAHRLERERLIIAAVEAGAGTLGDVVELSYRDVDPAFHVMAARSAGAHLRKLADDGMLTLPQGSEDWSSPIVVEASGEGSAP
jgi:glyoxylase-like metal-dependent hydrolase (beta-lactamase superfamily II)